MICNRPRWLFIAFTALSILIQPSAYGAEHLAGIEKLDRQLAAVARAVVNGHSGELMSIAVNRELFNRNTPEEVRWNAAAQIQVYLHFNRGGKPPAITDIEALGAADILVSPALGVVQAWLPADRLLDASAIRGVTSISRPRYARSHRAPPAVAQPRTGSVDTEGDNILGAAQFRQVTGLSGNGMVVAVISNGDASIAPPQASGDLPSNIWNDPNASAFGSSGDEGTAMMEIVYDLVPGVKRLGFCGPATTAEFLTCLDDFNSNIDPDVIVDDLGFPGEAMFTDGDFASAVQAFAVAHPQTLLVSAAGNDASSFWSGSWNTTATPVTVNTTVNGVTYTQALNFGSTISPNVKLTVSGLNPVRHGDTLFYIVEWDDPWVETGPTSSSGVANLTTPVFDVVLFDSSGNPIACNQGINSSNQPTPAGTAVRASGPCNQNNGDNPTNTPGPTPVQGSLWTNTGSAAGGMYLEVFLSPNAQNTPPRNGTNFKILMYTQQSGQLFLNPNIAAGSIFGQAAVPGEIAVGAVNSGTPDNIETYSSQGPVQLGIPGSGPGTLPATTRMKPDYVATDCVAITGAGSFPVPFCGTSAAAPHVAGLLALLKSAYISRTPLSVLLESAQPLGSTPPNGVFGNGRPDVNTLLTRGDYPGPTASISSPASDTTISAGSSLAFSGSCNAHGNTAIPTLDWSFGSGSGIADSTAGSLTEKFSNTGNFTVTLACTDSQGLGSASVNVRVTAPPPSGGGGGLEWFELIGLLSALAWRRRDRAMPAGFSVPAR